jgi:hypothetical protein
VPSVVVRKNVWRVSLAIFMFLGCQYFPMRLPDVYIEKIDKQPCNDIHTGARLRGRLKKNLLPDPTSLRFSAFFRCERKYGDDLRSDDIIKNK